MTNFTTYGNKLCLGVQAEHNIHTFGAIYVLHLFHTQYDTGLFLQF